MMSVEWNVGNPRVTIWLVSLTIDSWESERVFSRNEIAVKFAFCQLDSQILIKLVHTRELVDREVKLVFFTPSLIVHGG